MDVDNIYIITKIKLFFSTAGFYLVSAEDIAGVYFALYIIQGTIIAVRDDDVRTTLKLSQVVHHTTSEEGASIRQGRLIDYNLGALGFDTLHHTLNG